MKKFLAILALSAMALSLSGTMSLADDSGSSAKPKVETVTPPPSVRRPLTLDRTVETVLEDGTAATSSSSSPDAVLPRRVVETPLRPAVARADSVVETPVEAQPQPGPRATRVVETPAKPLAEGPTRIVETPLNPADARADTVVETPVEAQPQRGRRAGRVVETPTRLAEGPARRRVETPLELAEAPGGSVEKPPVPQPERVVPQPRPTQSQPQPRPLGVRGPMGGSSSPVYYNRYYPDGSFDQTPRGLTGR